MSSPGDCRSLEPCFKPLLHSEMLSAFAHLYLPQAKSWFLATVNKQDYFPFHQHGLLEDSCSSLREGCGYTQHGYRVPRLEACWPDLGSSHCQDTQGETVLS